MPYDSDDESLSSFDICSDQEHPENDLLKRSIIHLDVDCFYCQCEEISNHSLRLKPLAIGQKHIVVTSNYTARKMGVHKLMCRDEAKRICPSLIILEGSDLEPYRNASRKIYKAFRAAVKKLNPKNPTCKGGMDEYAADLTLSVNHGIKSESKKNYRENIWIYGDEPGIIEVKEDQSGEKMVTECFESERNDWNCYHKLTWGTPKEREECAQNLLLAAFFAKQIQDEVHSKTGFLTTVGVSTSPMLAKLVSDLKKPNSCNVMYPWRSVNIIRKMPLRKIPDLGSKTLTSISTCLEEYNESRKEGHWTCQHLLNVPPSALEICLSRRKQGGKSSVSDFCHTIIKRCKGVDTKTIIDDEGGLPKQISVENSFVRGSLTTIVNMKKELYILFGRLLRLLDNRIKESHNPHAAYPTSIRLTARSVDSSVACKRDRTTRILTRQRDFDGKLLVRKTSSNRERIDFLKTSTENLLQILDTCHNITRLNLAVLNFRDIKEKLGERCKGQTRLSTFFHASPMSDNQRIQFKDKPMTETESIGEINNDNSKEFLGKRSRQEKHNVSEGKYHKKHVAEIVTKISINECPSGMDPTVFYSLPPDIAREVITNHHSATGKKRHQKNAGGIKRFLTRK